MGTKASSNPYTDFVSMYFIGLSRTAFENDLDMFRFIFSEE